jgi:hypothetical protein
MWSYVKENKWKTLLAALGLGGYVYYQRQAALQAADTETKRKRIREQYFTESQTCSDVTLQNSFLSQLSVRLEELSGFNTTRSLLSEADKDEKQRLWKRMQIQGNSPC